MAGTFGGFAGLTPMRLRLLCCFFALFANDLMAAEPAAASKPPNILMIISDDQAWTDYGFMGSKFIQTPNIDRLAAESRTFPHGYDTNSLCSPSLASILTGRHVHRHGVTGNDPPTSVVKAAPGAKKAAGGKQKGADFTDGRAQLVKLFEQSPHLPRLLAERG